MIRSTLTRIGMGLLTHAEVEAGSEQLDPTSIPGHHS
jgi:hypothetical protein